MIKHTLATLTTLLLCALCYPVSSALAISTGSGSLEVSAGISYDENTLDFFYGMTPLETWSIAYIHANDNGSHDFIKGTQAIYEQNPILPGWNTAPDEANISAGDSNINVTFNHEDAMRPVGQSDVNMSTAGYPEIEITSLSKIIYYANVKATGNGSFTFFIDYDASLTGETTSSGDSTGLNASFQAAYYTMVYDEDDRLQWGNEGSAIETLYDNHWEQALDGASASLDIVAGRLALTVDYEEGDMFRFHVSGTNYVRGYSEDQAGPAPVPEPATILLLSGGLAGLAFYRRK